MRYRIPARTVTWGDYLAEKIRTACEHEGLNKSALFWAVAQVTDDGSRNTIAKLVDLTEPPVGRKDRSRAVALLLAIDVSPESLELAESDLSPTLHKLGSRRVRKAIRDGWVAGESNPEPADSGQISSLTCVRAGNGRY